MSCFVTLSKTQYLTLAKTEIIYRIVASTNTRYYSENQVFGVLQFEFYVVKGGATNRDMSLTETC